MTHTPETVRLPFGPAPHSDSEPPPAANGLLRLFRSPLLWGGLATCGFYLALPALPVGGELLTRYTTRHPLEYIETALFFLGMAVVFFKFVQLGRERRAFVEVPDLGPEESPAELPAAVAILRERVRTGSRALQGTYWGRRLEHILAVLDGRQANDGLDAHLSYLTEAEADRLHSSHALTQTIIWAIPLLGFLGTVDGITLAIANLTPEQLESSLNDITTGLGGAFDTTALALAYSLLLGFASLFVKRSEEQLLAEIDERCRLEAHRCFSPIAARPLLVAEEQAARDLLERTTRMIEHQTHVWSEAVDGIRLRWGDTLETQRRQLAETLQQGSQQTLETHSSQLAETRQQTLAAQEEISQRLLGQLDVLLARRQESEGAVCDALEQLSLRIAASAEQQSLQQAAETERLLTEFAARLQPWQDQMALWQERMGTLTESLAAHSAAVLSQGAQLQRIASEEGALLRLQESLNQNLEAVHTAGAFEETLHNLNAAVHLLTARVRPREAA